jgi:hypothetical protein
LLALAAAGTSAAGLMLVPAGALLLALVHRRRAALLWSLCGVALFAVYFIGYETPPYQGSFVTYLRAPMVPLRFFLVAAGGLALDAGGALAVGLALALFWAWLLASRRFRSLPPLLSACAAFLWLSFAAITWGRAGFGVQGAFLSRYRVYSELLLLVSLAALFWQLPRAHAMRLMWAAVPLSLVWLIATWRHELPLIEPFFIIHQTDLDYYVAEGHNVPNPLMPAPFRDFGLQAAREIGAYDAAPLARPARTLVEEPRAPDATRTLAGVWSDPPIVGKRAMMLIAHGAGHESHAVLWLENAQRRYRGKLEGTPRTLLALGERTGYLWGVYSLAGLAPGRYRLGVGVDDAPGPAVVWSAYSVEVE